MNPCNICWNIYPWNICKRDAGAPEMFSIRVAGKSTSCEFVVVKWLEKEGKKQKRTRISNECARKSNKFARSRNPCFRATRPKSQNQPSIYKIVPPRVETIAGSPGERSSTRSSYFFFFHRISIDRALSVRSTWHVLNIVAPDVSHPETSIRCKHTLAASTGSPLYSSTVHPLTSFTLLRGYWMPVAISQQKRRGLAPPVLHLATRFILSRVVSLGIKLSALCIVAVVEYCNGGWANGRTSTRFARSYFDLVDSSATYNQVIWISHAGPDCMHVSGLAN